jgi:diaminohydroxyphosphoribosylaminopyrimidine deaminase/5-amino-6-(5-phosphoribosylamino)uracil reductase
MRLALQFARRGYGETSPNPMVGAVLVKGGKIIGRGWHHRAGLPHAEIEALNDARKHGHNPKGATLYVTLEPCSTHGRTPPCTQAIITAGIERVVVGTRDPNPRHAGKGFSILRRARVQAAILDSDTSLSAECEKLNEAFNHWIVRRTPLVTVKAAMTLDGKIATATGESKWITAEPAREFAMRLRQGADAILAGVNTVIADDPSLTVRFRVGKNRRAKRLRRIVLDPTARTPLQAKVVADEFAESTTIVVSRSADKKQVAALAKRVNVLVAPQIKINPPMAGQKSKIDLRWLLKKLGKENITNLLVEGGGETNAAFLLDGLAQRVAFFYAPKVIGGRDSLKSVAGEGARSWNEIINLREIEWRGVGKDLFLTARVDIR